MTHTRSALRLSVLALILTFFADALTAQRRRGGGGRADRSAVQRSTPRSSPRPTQRSKPRSTPRPTRQPAPRARTPQRSGPRASRSAPSRRTTTPQQSTPRRSTPTRSSSRRIISSNRSRGRSITVPGRRPRSSADRNTRSTPSSAQRRPGVRTRTRTSSRRPTNDSPARRLRTTRNDRSIPRAVGRSVPGSRNGLRRTTRKGDYRDRLRTLYNRRSDTKATRDPSNRRRSQIVNRDLNDRFGKRLGQTLHKRGAGSKTNLRKASRVRVESNARPALGLGSRRDRLSTRAPSSIRHIPRSRSSNHIRPARRRPFTLASASREFHSGYHSSGHFSSLHFGFGFSSHHGHWGLYAYPYHYSHYLPYNYYRGYSSFAAYWGSHYSHHHHLPWWWPHSSYSPGRWSGYHSGYYYYAPTYYYPSYSSTAAYAAGSYEEAAELPTEEESEEDRIARLVQGHLDLGDFYFRQGRYKEAVESYMRALSSSPDDGSIHLVIADTLFAQGDYHYAAFMISKGLEFEPDLAVATIDKRSLYEDSKDFDRQMHTLQDYLSEKPFDAAVHMVLGYNLIYSGSGSAARAPLERALEINPGNLAAKTLLDGLTDKAATPLRDKSPEATKKDR